VNEMKEIFTKEIFPERKLAEFVISLPPTRNLEASSKSLTVTCVYGLVQGRIFFNNSIDVKHWILKQILESAKSIHPLMPALIQEYCRNLLIEGPQQKFSLVTEKELLTFFGNINESSNTNQNEVPQVYLAFYVLTFNTYVQSHKMKNISNLEEYSQEVLDAIPFRKIVRLIEKNEGFFNIYPLFISLAYHQLPHLFAVLNTLNEENSKSEIVPGLKFNRLQHAQYVFEISTANQLYEWPPTPQTITFFLNHCLKNPSQSLILFEWLQSLPAKTLEKYASPILRACLPLLLDPNCETKIQNLFKKCWDLLSTLIPQTLWTTAVNLLNNLEDEEVSHVDLVNDPLIILRCDPACFRNVTVYGIIIEILSAYIIASKQKMQIDYRPPINTNRVSNVKGDDLTALMFTQDALVLQMVIESINSQVVNRSQGEVLGLVDEIRRIACNFLHGQFIESPVLMKLVHFQGYDRNMIPVLVDGVPSMHICLDFIPELLLQGPLEKQLFAIWLAAHLAEKYPLQKSLDVCMVVISRFKSSRQRKDPKDFLMQAIPALITISRAFPHLSEDVCEILIDLKSKTGVAQERVIDLDHLIDDTFQTLVSDVILKGSSQSHLRS